MDSLPTICDTVLIDTVKNKIVVVQSVTTKDNSSKLEQSPNSQCGCYWSDITIELVWPVTILIVILICRRQLSILLESLVKRANKIKVGSLELELDKLNNHTEKAERFYSMNSSNKYQESDHRDFYNFSHLFGHDVKTNFLAVSLEIEDFLRLIYRSKIKREVGNTPFSVPEIIETLYAENVIERDLLDLLREFWKFRNNIVHAHKYTIQDEEFLAITDIGIRVLRILIGFNDSFYTN